MPLTPVDPADITRETLDFPIGDKVYRVKPVTGREGFRLSALQEAATDVLAGRITNEQANAKLSGMSDEQAHSMILGSDVFNEMMDDGVLYVLIRRASTAALLWHTSMGNTEAAEAVWSGKASSPRTLSDKGGDEGNATPTVSTSGTSSPTSSSKPRTPRRGGKSGSTSS